MKLKKALATVGAAAGFLTAGAVAANADQVTVQAGDTVSKIALEHNTTVEQIRVLNNLADVNLIYVGQILEVGENGQTQTQNQAQTQVAPAAQSASQAVASYNAGYQNVTANNSYNNNTNNNYSYNAGTTTQPAAANNNYQAASLGGSEDEARAWIANKESGGSYTARNGQYIGKYQLSSSYLNGDYSAANQERVAQQYVQQRYGSWQGAKSFWQSHGWY